VTQYNLGTSSIKPNQDGSEDEESEEPSNEAWREFLNIEDEVMSLKTLGQAKSLGGNKRSLSMAFSEFIRQAWSEYSFHGALFSLSDFCF